MNAPRQLGRSPRPRRPRLLGALLLLCLLLPAGPYAPAAPAQTPDQVPHFTGLVQYDPGGGDLLPQAGVPVFLYGYPQSGGPPVLLRSALTAPDGSFDLYTRTAAFSAYVVLKDEVRGLIPFTATPGLNGLLWDPSAVLYTGDTGDRYTRFLVRDALRFVTPFRERYLIVTSAAVVPALEDFIAYKKFLGFDVRVITVEELDPTGIGGQFRRDQIRTYERSLDESPGGLKYVLLIGTDATIPFLKVMPGGADWVRYPYEEWPHECKEAAKAPHEANMCGHSTDWYYVDLYSDWDSNNDQVLGEGFWAPPEQVKDDPPAFHVDVYLGRLPFDSPATVEQVLKTIMAFEQDDGDWKKHVLLAGAMNDLGGWAWDPPDNVTGTYKPVGPPTDNAYLMEHAYSDYLLGEGFSPVRLYEKDHPPNCNPPSSFPVDAPLSLENVTAEWTSQDFGLVKVAGHGSAKGVGRRVWARDYDTPCVVENPTRPFNNKSLEEIDGISFLLRGNAAQMLSPSAKATVLMANSCSTGAWYLTNTLPSAYMAAGRIAAWIGATHLIHYLRGWTSPSQDSGQAVDYQIGKAIFQQNLPLGDGVWTGLDNVRQQFGANWGNGKYTLAFLSYDLYGDPSMDFWGNGADVRGPWPMFHYDWAGLGQTSLAGPGLFGGHVYWTVDIAPTPAGSRVPSPVINRDDRIVIGDASGIVRSIDMDGNVLWSYPTDGPIDTAPALGLAGTIYVQTKNGTLYAIRENGTLYWSRAVGQSDASPKVGPNGWIYVGGSDNNGPGGSTRYLMMAYRSDGERKGMIELDGRVTTTPSFGKDGGVLVGTAAGTLYELTPHLEMVGSYPLGMGYAIGDGLAVADDVMQTVLVPTTGGFLIAWTNLYNFPLWYFSGCGPLRSAPAVSQDSTVIFGSQEGKVYGIRLADGEKVWEYDTGGPVDSSPALDPVFAYVVGGNPARLYTLRIADGTFSSGSIEIGGSAQGGSSPAIGEGKMLYVASAEGALYAIGKINLPQPPKLYARAWPWEIVVQIHPADGTSWHLLERRLPGGQWSALVELAPGVTEFHDNTVLPGLRYQYRALGFGGLENPDGTKQQPEYSEYSPIVEVRALRAVPAAPGAPTVTPLSSSELRLEWRAAPTASIALRIWRLDPGQADYAEIALLPGEATSFDDGELLSDTTYFYRLQAVDEAGDSPLSEPGGGTTWARTLPPPRQVTVYPLEDWAFRVCWVPGGSEYESIVARAAAGEAEAGEIGHVSPGQACFTDTHGFPSSFVYQVKHVAGQDESEWALSAPTDPPEWLVVQAIYLPVVLKSAGP